MAKYSFKIKFSVVQYYLQGKGGYLATANKFHIDESAVRKWIALFKLHGIEALKKKPKSNYTPEFKSHVIETMRHKMWSTKQAASHFNIPGFSSIGVWEKLYDQGRIGLSPDQSLQVKPMVASRHSKPSEKPPEEMSHEELLAEVRFLRTEHAYLKKLDALIQQKRLEEKRKQK